VAVPPAVLDDDVLILRLGGAGPQHPTPAAPRPAQPEGHPPAPTTTRDTYVVQPGDTLSEIARRELGSAQFADELARLNKITDPGALRVGQVIRLR